MADLPGSVGIGRGEAVKTLGWSVAVVLAGGVIAAFTTPSASGPSVVQQSLGLPVPAEEAAPGATGGPGSTVGAAVAGAPGAAAAGTAAAADGAAGAPAPSTAPKGPASTQAAAKAAATPATAAKAAALKVQPDPGTYPMSISGSSSVDGKPAPVPSSGSLVVSQQGGDQQHRTVGMPGDLVVVQRASASGVDLVSFSLSAGGKTLTFRPASPVPFVRTDPGASWSWSVRSTDGTVGISQTARVTGSGSVSVGGAAVPAATVERVFTVSGAVQGTVRLTSSVSTTDRLPLRQHQAIDVKATVLGLLSTRIVSDTTATLTSTRPR